MSMTEVLASMQSVGLPAWAAVFIWSGWIIRKELHRLRDDLAEFIRCTEARLVRLEVKVEEA